MFSLHYTWWQVCENGNSKEEKQNKSLLSHTEMENMRKRCVNKTIISCA